MMKELNELAEEIVARLVDCESADPEPVEQYKEWTRKQIAEAFRALERGRNDYRNKFLEMEQRL